MVAINLTAAKTYPCNPPPPSFLFFSPLYLSPQRYEIATNYLEVQYYHFRTLLLTRRISILLCMSLRMSTLFYIQKRPRKKAFPIPQLKIATIVPNTSSRIHNEKQTSV